MAALIDQMSGVRLCSMSAMRHQEQQAGKVRLRRWRDDRRQAALVPNFPWKRHVGNRDELFLVVEGPVGEGHLVFGDQEKPVAIPGNSLRVVSTVVIGRLIAGLDESPRPTTADSPVFGQEQGLQGVEVFLALFRLVLRRVRCRMTGAGLRQRPD